MNSRRLRLLVCAILALLPVSAANSAEAPKAGGILNATHRSAA